MNRPPSPAAQDGDDLQALGQAAHRQLQARAAGRLERPAAAVGMRLALVLAVWSMLLAVAVFDLGHVRTTLFGVPRASMVSEVEATLRAAKAAVDAHHKLTGEWPDRVPLAALAALVAYERTATGYRLGMRLGEVSASLDDTGTLTRN